jgi:hypothetical protein
MGRDMGAIVRRTAWLGWVLAFGPACAPGSTAADGATPVATATAATGTVATGTVTTALDLAGNAVDPLAGDPGTLVVLTFVTPDCPVSNRYAPELGRIAAAHPELSWWLVYPDPDVDAAQIEAHRREYALPGTPLRDPEHVLVARAGVVVTPEVAVFRRGDDGPPLYRGRIDDRVPQYGRARPEPTRRDHVIALEAIGRGAAAPEATTVAVGCPIDDLR